MRGLLASVLSVTVVSTMAAQGQAVFRSNADEVLVDVSVTRGESAVKGLTAADFVLTDNGVRQTIQDASINSGDIDVTLVIQREGVLSTLLTDSQGQLAGLRRQASEGSIDAARVQVRRLIQPADGLRVLSADAEVRLGEESQSKSGRSSILDGLTAAMMLRPTEVGRRHLIIGVTGGTDDRSFVPERSRLNVALRTDAVVHIIALGQGMLSYLLPNGKTGGTTYGVGVAAAPLKPIAEATGGRLYQIDPGSNVEKRLGPALDEFRTRYLLRYVPTGVARSGWHDIVVTVPSGKFEVRHRRGYEIGKSPGLQH